jgi:hypothetical protein
MMVMALTERNRISIALSRLSRLAEILGFAPGGGPTLLPVQYIHQEQDNWCWAACCEMLLLFLHRTHLSQCAMASRQFGADCCAQPSGAACNLGCWPEDAYGAFGVNIDRRGYALAQADLDNELAAMRPVEICYLWRESQGRHVALITGKYPNGDYEVHDPWYGKGPRDFDTITSAYSLGEWELSYVNVGVA